MNQNKRLVINTGIQYLKTIVNAIFALIAVRFLMQGLGKADYGVYQLIAGVVGLAVFVPEALTISTQRFISFYLGAQKLGSAKDILVHSFYIHLLMAGLVVLIFEALYYPMFHGVLNFPPESLVAAQWVYQFTILMFVSQIMLSPFKALTIAHENFTFIAVMDMGAAFLRLALALVLLYVSMRALVFYGFGMALIMFVSLIIYWIHSHKKYEEAQSLKIQEFKRSILVEMFKFATWSLYSRACVVGRTQGLTIILNRAYGTIMNASYGLALQISTMVAFVSTSLNNALAPQIIKAEGDSNRKKVFDLAQMGSKFSTLLLAIVCIPLVYEFDTIIYLWLTEVPEGAIFFCRVMLITAVADQISTGLGSANQAIGDVKWYAITVFTIKLITLPIAWLILHYGYSYRYVMVVYFMTEFMSALMRIAYFKVKHQMKLSIFFKSTIAPILISLGVILLGTFLSALLVPNFKLRLLIDYLIVGGLFLPIYYFFLMSQAEKILVKPFVQKLRPRKS